MFKYRVLNVSSECGQQDRVHNQAEGARGASSAPRIPGMRFPWIEDIKIQDPFVGHLPSLDLLRKCFGPDDKLIRNGQKEVFRLLHGARIKGHTSPCTH